MSATARNSPEITVILPVYNAEKYVASSVESILKQTFDNFELILIDDGSTDRSLEVLQRFAASDDRVAVHTRENRGLIETLNEGISRAKGAYIARMDADDIATPDRFLEQISFLKKNDYDICGSAIQCFDQKSLIWRYPLTPEEIEIHLLFNSPFAHPTVMCRATVLKALKYSSDFPSAEDYDLWQRVWKGGFKGGNIDKVLLYYRVHPLQVSQTRGPLQRNLANSVRQRHWTAVVGNEYRPKVERLLKIYSDDNVDFNEIFPLFQSLATQYSGAARKYFLAQVFSLAVRVAATSNRPWSIWRNLLQGSNADRNIVQEFILFAVWAFRLGSRNRLYQFAKSYYLTKW